MCTCTHRHTHTAEELRLDTQEATAVNKDKQERVCRPDNRSKSCWSCFRSTCPSGQGSLLSFLRTLSELLWPGKPSCTEPHTYQSPGYPWQATLTAGPATPGTLPTKSAPATSSCRRGRLCSNSSAPTSIAAGPRARRMRPRAAHAFPLRRALKLVHKARFSQSRVSTKCVCGTHRLDLVGKVEASAIKNCQLC